jgi:excisionase family DNA binding protein
MGDHVDPGADTAWLSTGEAAKLVGMDRRTIIRWADTGAIEGTRITPGGVRKISRQGLLAAFDRQKAGKSRGAVSLTAERAAPEISVLYLAEAAPTWQSWTPDHLKEPKLWELLEAVRAVRAGLEDIEAEIEDALRQRD